MAIRSNPPRFAAGCPRWDLDPRRIRTVEDTAGSTFRDGRSVAAMAEDLRAGHLKAADVEPVCIVRGDCVPKRRRSSEESIGRFQSLVLRHDPGRIGISLASDGWVEVKTLLSALSRHGRALSRHELAAVVATNDKRHFVFDETGARIRASQGHGVAVDLGYAPAVPPETLFHGTVAPALEGIRRQGLRAMARHHVHLSADYETAVRIGGRRGKPVVLRVRAGAMHAAGHVFFLSANGVWLTGTVPAAFLDFDLPIGSGNAGPAG